MTAPTALEVLPPQAWQDAESAHHERVDRLCAGHRDRARSGQAHPVEDFLFTYYSLRPGRLRRWHPGPRIALAGPAARERLGWRHYTAVEQPGRTPAVAVDLDAFLRRRGETVRFVRALLAATASSPAQLGCFGLHEWAMVYRLPDGDLRHTGWPLRLGSAGTDAVLEAHPPRCTHIDAFRFFTPRAQPMNAVRPTRERQVELEQPGCLHATMDLYKWAYKLLPGVPSELVADCFELAREIRELDMRASPYDLRALGYQPVAIETPQGRAEYVEEQRGFAARGGVLRRRLLAACDALLPVPTSADGT